VSDLSAPIEIEVEIPPSAEFVVVVRHVLGALARIRELDPDVVEDVKLAVSEACTNSVTMSERAGSSDPIVVRGAVAGGRFHVWVADRGPRMEATGPPTSSTDSLDFSFERGLSLPLIRGLVDELEISERDGGGNVVRMVLSGRGSPAD
jgi:serine/threonine-protein kinase RsbW